ncbi:hypothetical protein [Caldivirga sp.]|uniref:hypothetical protein n=1 Tax=Caldivirga sp. TaxID=2080243 RepID=UPI0025C5E4BF|nr:hypothetical protein [Caldivirga sp.]
MSVDFDELARIYRRMRRPRRRLGYMRRRAVMAKVIPYGGEGADKAKERKQ